MNDPLERGPLESMIAGALRDCITAHGPITKQLLASAAKRIAGGVIGFFKTSAKEAMNSAEILVMREEDEEYRRLRAKNKSLRKQRYDLLEKCRAAGLIPKEGHDDRNPPDTPGPEEV